jgi:3-phosphoshikimate 1-carboxyvinyltransferase
MGICGRSRGNLRKYSVRDSLTVQTTGPLRATVSPPGSKSITNRALICAALAAGSSRLTGALDSEDTRVMIQALRQIGIAVDEDLAARTLRVFGCSGKIASAGAELYAANSGTTIRFLTALLTLGQGTFRLDGTPRMRQRPIGDMIDALAQLGAIVASEHQAGFPPVIIRATGLRGGRTCIRGNVSSQFLSGLLMVAPYSAEGIELEVEGQLVSQPYVRMTIAVMEAFGIQVETDGLNRFRIAPGGKYKARQYAIEPDASAASYFFGAAAVTGGEITVVGLSQASLQGDVALVEELARMGCEVRHEADRITVVGRPMHGIDVDMNAISDTVPTLAAVALFADGPTTIHGVEHIRHKETDRIHAVAVELRKVGAEVEEFPDGLRITPGPLHGAGIDTYDDHRMAMSMALVGLQVPGIVIHDPDCTHKTYPDFFRDLAALSKA